MCKTETDDVRKILFLLAGSVTSVTTTGLDEIDLIIGEYGKTGDTWTDAQ
ncbi:MAG: hypothetical protein IKR31_09075 [Prevotella sp.]|nr:hypothetical protein [Prevotella sp.]